MISVLITGGTFDKEDHELHGRLYFKDTHLPEMLRLGRCRVSVEVETIMLVDSLNMTDADRQRIAAACRNSPLIAHRHYAWHRHDGRNGGGDRRGRARQDDRPDRRDGALRLRQFGRVFNLGSAISFVQSLPHGVYVAMNGTHFEWHNVRKNRETGYSRRRAKG